MIHLPNSGLWGRPPYPNPLRVLRWTPIASLRKELGSLSEVPPRVKRAAYHIAPSRSMEWAIVATEQEPWFVAKYDESDSEFRLFGGPISLDVTGEVAKHLREVPLSKPHGEWEVNYRSTYVPNSGLWLVVKVWISPDDPLVFPLRQAFNVWGRPRR